MMATTAKQMTICAGQVKTAVLFLAVSDTIFEILGRCRGPFVASNVVSRLSTSCSSLEILASKLPLS